MIGGWLKKFRSGRLEPQRKPAVADPRQLKNPTAGKPKTGRLDQFHDDEADPNWLDRFHDDEAGPKGRSKRKPAAQPQPPSAPSINIRLFEWLMYLSFGVEVATTASDYPKLAKLAGGWPVVVLTEVFTLVFFGAFIFVAVYLRKKWALYVIAAFYGFRLLRYLPSFSYIALPLVQFLSAVEFILQGLALFYAFSEEARAHFAKPKR